MMMKEAYDLKIMINLRVHRGAVAAEKQNIAIRLRS